MHLVILLTFFRKKVVILTMDKASKKELLSIIAQQEEDLNRYRTRFQGKALYICSLNFYKYQVGDWVVYQQLGQYLPILITEIKNCKLDNNS